MIGKQQRRDTVFLLWCGEKGLSGDPFTPEEQRAFIEARQRQIRMVETLFRITPDEYEYIPGQVFEDK